MYLGQFIDGSFKEIQYIQHHTHFNAYFYFARTNCLLTVKATTYELAGYNALISCLFEFLLSTFAISSIFDLGSKGSW